MNKTVTFEVPEEGFVKAWALDDDVLLLQKANFEAAVFNKVDKTVGQHFSLPSAISASLSISPERLIIGCENSSIRICRLDTETVTLLNNPERRAPIQSITLRNNEQFISTDAGGVLKIWDIKTGECIHEHKCNHSLLSVNVTDEDHLILLATDLRDYYEYQYTVSTQSLVLIKTFRSNGKCSSKLIQQVVIDSPDKIRIFRTPTQEYAPISIWVEEPPKDASNSITEVSSTLAPNDSAAVATVSRRGNWACYFSPTERTVTLVENPEFRSHSGPKVYSK